MGKKKHDLLTISEMAHLCRTTKDTLYFYERKGLLHPSFIDENGYRYYDRNNFYSMDMYLSLREAGSSVNEIAKFLENPSPAHYLNHMKAKRNDIRRKLSELMVLEGRISESIALAQEGLFRTPGELFIENQPCEYLVCKYCEDHDDPKISGECFMNVLKAVQSYNVPYDFHISAFISQERFASGVFFPDYYYAISPIKILGHDVLVKPASRFLCIIHEGEYNDAAALYPKMLAYIAEHDLKVTGNAYEQTLIGWLNSKDSSNYRTKLSIQID